MRMLALLSTAVFATAAYAQDVPDGEAADRIFTNGVIYTAEEGEPQVEAVAVTDGVISFAGTREEAMTLGDEATEIVDLQGAAMYPGFTDSHVHLIGVGQRELTLNLEGSESLAGMLDKVETAAGKGEGLVYGRGWIETDWPENRMPTRDDLDAVAPDRPVVLVRADGHALVANSAALEAAGIGPDTPDPEGGRIERDENGRATGMLIDNAMNPAQALLGEPSAAERRQALKLGAGTMARLGWTGGHNMSVTEAQARDLDALAKSGELPLRVYNSLDWGDDVLFEEGPWASPDRRNITRAYKVYADGALGSRGAALLQPYHDHEGSGLMLTSEEEIMPFLVKALEQGIQVNTHAIGDRANRKVLDWYSQAFVEVPPDQRAVRNPRWRIEHAQIVNPADIERFAELGVIASMQPSHAIGDLFFAEDRLGLERLEGAYAWQSLIDAGAMIVAGSDAPVERGDPRIEFYAAIARAGQEEGFQGEGWHPEEAVSRQTALKMFTAWPAYASFREDELGTITEGKRADFSVFREDLMTVPPREILTAQPLMTVLDGETVWKAEDALWTSEAKDAAETETETSPETLQVDAE